MCVLTLLTHHYILVSKNKQDAGLIMNHTKKINKMKLDKEEFKSMNYNDGFKREKITLKSLSIMFDIPLWTLRSWASKRLFPMYKISNRIYVDIEEFRIWQSQYYVEARKRGEDG